MGEQEQDLMVEMLKEKLAVEAVVPVVRNKKKKCKKKRSWYETGAVGACTGDSPSLAF